VLSNWLATIGDAAFLKKSSDLYPRLHANATNCWREAETATLNGVSLFGDASASGGVAVSGFDAPDKSVTFTNVGMAQQFVLHYAAANPGTIGLYVNSQPRRSLPIAATDGTYRDLLVHAAVPVNATVKIQFDAGDVSVNLDSVLFRGYEDSDGDGLPDDWERWRFGSLIYDANDDPDQDGSSNYPEFVADTDPLDSGSVFRISNLSMNSAGATITFQPSPGRTHFIQQSSDLKNWTFLPVAIRTNTPSVSITRSNLPSDKLFLRLMMP
jgi:hypothetical protein